MKYKAGEEVLIKCKIEENRYKDHYLITPQTEFGASPLYIVEDDVYNTTDLTAEEAWEIAKKMLSIGIDDLKKCFGRGDLHTIDDFFRYFTPQKAKEKIEAWKENKKLHVGDIVEFKFGGERAVILDINNNTEEIDVFTENSCSDIWDIRNVKKTEYKADLESLLKQIRGV